MRAAPAGARNGPSRLNPSGSAPSAGASGSHARTRSANATSSSSGAVTAVGRNEVTPRRSSAARHAVERRAIAHRVVAAPAVDVDVDEPRGDVRPVRVRLGVDVDRDDPAVLDRDPADRDPIVEDQPAAGGARRARGRHGVGQSLRRGSPRRSPPPMCPARRSRSRPRRATSCGRVVAARRGWARAAGRRPPRSRRR